MWESISLNELNEIIHKTEHLLNDQLQTLWRLIRIQPEKWHEDEFGKKGGGFWVVGICGKRIIWYNDIEDGFNISEYKTYGFIPECKYEQYELNHVIIQLNQLAAFI